MCWAPLVVRVVDSSDPPESRLMLARLGKTILLLLVARQILNLGQYKVTFTGDVKGLNTLVFVGSQANA